MMEGVFGYPLGLPVGTVSMVDILGKVEILSNKSNL